MAKAEYAQTFSSDVWWFGENIENAREEVNAALPRALSDAEWEAFSRIVRRYSMELNHEFTAAPFAQQRKAARRVAIAAHELLEAIEAADTTELGQFVTRHVGEAWEELHDLAAAYDRDEDAMGSDLIALLVHAGHDSPEDQANELLSSWRWAGRLQRPDPPADFRNALRTFSSAASLAAGRTENGEIGHATADQAWVFWIGELHEWLKGMGFPASATKSEAASGRGLTAIVRIINALIPEFSLAETPQGRQMRRSLPDQDDSLGAAILSAIKAYKKGKEEVSRGEIGRNSVASKSPSRES